MDNISTQHVTAQQRIWQVVAQIPVGKVASYGQVAQLAGLGQGARLVGRVLSQLPDDTKLPWHRVINAQGKISFAPDSAAYLTQLSRLQAEGVCFNKQRVIKSHWW